MSDTPQQQSLGRQLSGRWQVPLLVFSVVMLIAGIWRMRPAPKLVTFDEQYAYAVSLKDAQLYPEASEYVEKLLNAPECLPEESRRLHLLMAQIIFAHEMGNRVHGQNNAQQIIEHTERALGQGESHDPEAHRMRALACEWLRRDIQALAEYQQAVDKGITCLWEVRKRIIEVRRKIGGLTADQLHAAYDEFLTNEGVSDELKYWAAEQKVDIFGREDKHDQAARFLADHAMQFSGSAMRTEYDYLQALAWFHLQRFDEAERLLRNLRDQLRPADSLYIRSGWLLGKVLQAAEAPEFALGFFNDVLKNGFSGPYWTASMLGRAETLADLERFDESMEAFNKVIELMTEDPYGALIDLRDVRLSATALYHVLLADKRLAEAMSYLRIASRLAPPADNEQQIVYSKWLADLAYDLGKAALDRSRGDRQPESSEAGQEAKRYLVEAGEEYLHLAKLTTMDESASSDSTWQAIKVFDDAGERRRTAEVLEAFILERPMSTRIPEALKRLGDTYQALGEFDKAIAKYQQNLVDYPRTLPAAASLVPLAVCFMAVDALDKAEQTLLRIVDHNPQDRLTTIEPASNEYRDALYLLGRLYIRKGAYEQAIARYEEALERYSQDVRAGQATFMLADTYRQSAARIGDDLADSKNAAYQDHLRQQYQKRMKRARELYGEVIERYRSPAKSPSSEPDLNELYVKLSHFYCADTVYNLSHVAERSDLRPFAEALELYGRAAWFYPNDPMVMSAYLQMINCHLRMGNTKKARMALHRAKWALKGISDAQFQQHASDEDRKFWTDYLTWLEQTPPFASMDNTSPG